MLFVYTTSIVDYFGYEGYINKLNYDKVIFSPLVIIFAFALLRNNGLPSYFHLNLIIASTVTPSLAIFCGADLPLLFAAVTGVAFAIVALVTGYSNVPRIRMKYINSKFFLSGLVVLCLFYIASIFAFGGGKYLNFNIMNVYQFRAAASANLPGIYGYFMPSFSKVIIPVGIVLSILYRRKILLILFIICAVLLFALSAHKSVLFIPFMVIFIYWFSNYRKSTALALIVFMLILIVGCVDIYIAKSGAGGLWGIFGSIGVRRAFYVPSWLNWAYFDFFSTHPYTYWADSKFSLGFVDRTYEMTMSHVIGEIHLAKENLGANTGWIGSGMGNAGCIGIVFYSVLIGLILSFLDSYSKKLGYSFVLSISAIPILTMTTGSDLMTMFLTHGLVVLFLILIFVSPNRKDKRGQVKKA